METGCYSRSQRLLVFTHPAELGAERMSSETLLPLSISWVFSVLVSTCPRPPSAPRVAPDQTHSSAWCEPLPD